MPFAGEAELFMSVPSCYWERQSHMPPVRSKSMHHIHREMEKANQIVRSPAPADFKHQPFFQREPREYTQELYKKQTEKLESPAYIINCYDTYPSSKVSTALHNKKALGFRDAIVFSLCDQGSVCPILVIQLASLYRCNTIVICMEELYGMSESWDEGRGYPKSEAAALFQLSPDSGEWKVEGFRRQWPLQPAPHTRMADSSIQVMKDILAQAGVTPEQTLVVPQRLSVHYEERIGAAFPHIYTHNGQENLLTADPFYSLEHMHARGMTKDWPYILLNFADHKAVGCLLLSAAYKARI